MSEFTLVVLMLVCVTVFGIVLVAVLGMPVAFAGTISAFGIGAVTAIVRFWPKEKD